jgi:putative FmdB family regulatory protein
MPVYEYVCMVCNNKFEVLRRISQADDPIPCNICHSTETSKQISLFNASSQGRSMTNNQSCSSCSGGSCSSCNQ